MNAQSDVGVFARAHARWHWSEIAFWCFLFSCGFLLQSRFLIMTEIVRLALFALSLDLILGYAGIVSLGHAAFFGIGAYGAGLLALLTEWDELRWLDYARVAELMSAPRAVVDARNLLDPVAMRRRGFVYQGVGRS